ncbi:dihydrofolate reductase family protein [Streptomyces sp. NPDC048603]|uniref:dihydrofolate reductase family protein n=1 Tax=Streptomyces sp. NPDC048603 TaxID=3365577 RepID=UPI003717B879
MRKLTYFIGVTIDGFIAAPDGGFDFFPLHPDPEYAGFMAEEYPEIFFPAPARKAFGLPEPELKRFDAVIMGRATYDPGLQAGLTQPYSPLKHYVVSRSLPASTDPEVEFISGDVVARVRELKAEDGLGIYLCGGADLAGQLVEEIDEFVLKTYPVFAGSGIPMTRAGFAPRDLELTGVRSFTEGQVVTTYARKRS